MKKTILFLILLPLIGKAQVDGIGPFRIGRTTTSIIDSIAKAERIKVKTSYDLMETFGSYSFKDKPSKIYLLGKKDGGYDMSDPKYRPAQGCQVYFIDYYQVAGIPIKKLYLSFYQDTLYQIYCDGDTKIEEAVTLKYGEGVITRNSRKIKCQSKFTGGEFEEEESDLQTTWDKRADSIIASSRFQTYYDEKCKEQFISYFMIVNKPVSTAITNAEVAMRNKKSEEELKEKKSKLKDF
jgi:hypothetical protein